MGKALTIYLILVMFLPIAYTQEDKRELISNEDIDQTELIISDDNKVIIDDNKPLSIANPEAMIQAGSTIQSAIDQETWLKNVLKFLDNTENYTYASINSSHATDLLSNSSLLFG